MVAEPAVGATSPSSIRRVVVFPAPLGPRSPTTRPGASCTVRSSTATTSPKRLVRPSKAMTDMDRCPLVSGGIGDRCPLMATVRIGRRGVVGRARGSRSASGSSHEYCSRVMTRRTGPRYGRRRDQSSSAAGPARHPRGHRRRRRPRRHGAGWAILSGSRADWPADARDPDVLAAVLVVVVNATIALRRRAVGRGVGDRARSAG